MPSSFLGSWRSLGGPAWQMVAAGGGTGGAIHAGPAQCPISEELASFGQHLQCPCKRIAEPGLPGAFLRGLNLVPRGQDIPCVMCSHGQLSFGAVLRLARPCFYRSTGLIIHPQAGQAACSHSVGVLAILAHLMVGGWVQSVQESLPQPRSALP